MYLLWNCIYYGKMSILRTTWSFTTIQRFKMNMLEWKVVLRWKWNKNKLLFFSRVGLITNGREIKKYWNYTWNYTWTISEENQIEVFSVECENKRYNSSRCDIFGVAIANITYPTKKDSQGYCRDNVSKFHFYLSWVLNWDRQFSS